MAKRKKSGAASSGGMSPEDAFALMFSSLNLILLSFFILLNSLSVKDNERERKAIGSLRGTFGILEGGENPWNDGKFLMRSDPVTSGQQARKKGKEGETVSMILRRAGLFAGNANVLAVMTADGLSLEFQKRIAFLPGRTELNPKIFPTLDKIGAAIARAGREVFVRGYADGTRTLRYPTNLVLSTLRAAEVARYLVRAAKVPGRFLVAEGRGVKLSRVEGGRVVQIFIPEKALHGPLERPEALR